MIKSSFSFTEFQLLVKTGSGKTYTMGTNYTADTNSGGIIPKVMESIFTKVYEMRDSAEFLIRVSFIEVGLWFRMFLLLSCYITLRCVTVISDFLLIIGIHQVLCFLLEAADILLHHSF